MGVDVSDCWASVRVYIGNLHTHEMSEFLAAVAYWDMEDGHGDFQWTCGDTCTGLVADF